MALVHVEHLGGGEAFELGERPDRTHTADTGEDLLPDPVLLITAIEPVGDRTQLMLILRDVRVQQQQRNSADLGDPDPSEQPGAIGQGQFDEDGRPLGVGQQPQRQPLGIQRRIALVLPSVGGQRLAEISGAVVQTHRDQRQPEIGRRLQMVAGEYPQAARVVRQHLGDAELHREVRDPLGQFGVLFAGELLVPQRPAQVVVQLGGQPVETLDEGVVGGQLLQSRRSDLSEQGNRITADLLPQRGVDLGEQILGRFVPGPAQIDRKPLEGSQLHGKVSTDGEPTESFHAWSPYCCRPLHGGGMAGVPDVVNRCATKG